MCHNAHQPDPCSRRDRLSGLSQISRLGRHGDVCSAMAEPTQREQRLGRIANFHEEAAKLLASAEHASMKNQVLLAICDLEEATA